ncbi:hypothetical protein [Lysobacter humi (ex Lee et al. 2017)]
MHSPPKWLRGVGIAALVWNLLGCMAFAMDLAMTPDDVAKLDAVQRAMYESRPVWSIVGTALAVVGGALGSLGLALYRRWAMPLLAASLLGVLLQDAGMLLAAPASPGPVVIGMQGLVLVVAVALVALAAHARSRGWLR